jgi:hypothetical protein
LVFYCSVVSLYLPLLASLPIVSFSAFRGFLRDVFNISMCHANSAAPAAIKFPDHPVPRRNTPTYQRLFTTTPNRPPPKKRAAGFKILPAPPQKKAEPRVISPLPRAFTTHPTTATH